jgi:hypothetical protein
MVATRAFNEPNCDYKYRTRGRACWRSGKGVGVRLKRKDEVEDIAEQFGWCHVEDEWREQNKAEARR